MPIFKLLTNKFTYQKKDKLKSRKQMQFLFSKGTAINMHPIRLLYTIEKEEAGIFSNGLLQAGAVVGALFSGLTADFFGRFLSLIILNRSV
jgi:hypothetical protein